MEATTLIHYQHQRLTQVACALEHERHHVAALRRELVADFDRHLAALKYLTANVRIHGLRACTNVVAAVGEVRRVIEQLRLEGASRYDFVEHVRKLRALLVAYGEVLEAELVGPMRACIDAEELESLGSAAESALWSDGAPAEAPASPT